MSGMGNLINQMVTESKTRLEKNRALISKLWDNEKPYIIEELNMKPKRRPKITFKKTTAGRQKGAWRYTIKAPNGELLVTSEGHTSKRDAQRAFDTLVELLCVYSKWTNV